MSRLSHALDQLKLARQYTVSILDKTDEADWFRMPPGGVSHVAWQVGHLAMASYRLGLELIRGVKPDDELMYPKEFQILFGRLSVPQVDPKNYPSARRIREIFDNVHRQALTELASIAEEDLDMPPTREHRIGKTKYLTLLWCAGHEFLHAGQIGMIRRQLGYEAIW